MQIAAMVHPHQPLHFILFVSAVFWLGGFLLLVFPFSRSIFLLPSSLSDSDLFPDSLPSSELLSCPSCNFTSNTTPVSTSRDVILIPALTSCDSDRFIRTLRTTGSRARVIVFFSKPKSASALCTRYFKPCDAEPVFLQTDLTTQSRYSIFAQWLRAHHSEIDRVIVSDSIDIIFQGDPFQILRNSTELLFACESRRVQACNGVIAGPIRRFLSFLDAAKGGRDLNVRLFRNRGEFLLSQRCARSGACLLDERGVVSIGRVVPSLVQGYGRWLNATRQRSEICPISTETYG
jgi:hypothetical protein